MFRKTSPTEGKKISGLRHKISPIHDMTPGTGSTCSQIYSFHCLQWTSESSKVSGEYLSETKKFIPNVKNERICKFIGSFKISPTSNF